MTRRSKVVLTAASEVKPEPVTFLWDGRVPLRALTVLAGEPGLAKTLATHELAARVSRGELDGAFKGEPRDVLLASAEDDFASVIVPRLIAAGADLERVHDVKITERDESGFYAPSLLTLPDHIAELDAECARLEVESGRRVGLLVVDPISAFLSSSADSHKTADVRRALAPLASLAEREGLAVIAVAHLNKSTAAKLIDRLSGSGAFGAAPRSVLVLARHPDDPQGEQGRERVIVHVKSNYSVYAPTLAAKVAPVSLSDELGSVPTLAMLGDCPQIGPDDLRATNADASGEDCEQSILAAVEAGERPSGEVKREVSESLGCSRRTVERAAGRLVERGELVIDSRGHPRRTFWTVATPGETERVATSRVVTEQTRMFEPSAPVSEGQSRHDTDGGATGPIAAALAESNGHSPRHPGTEFGSMRLDSQPNGGTPNEQ